MLCRIENASHVILCVLLAMLRIHLVQIGCISSKNIDDGAVQFIWTALWNIPESSLKTSSCKYWKFFPFSDDMKTIKTMFTPLLKENSMKHIDYKTFNSIQVMMMLMAVWQIEIYIPTSVQPYFNSLNIFELFPHQAIANPATEARYNYLQCKVADSVSSLL